MKKKIFSLAFITIVACSDMQVTDADKVENELPKGFSVSEYVTINPDVKISQLALDIRTINSSVTINSSGRAANCKRFLSDVEFAKEIYLDYLGCPRESWDSNISCDGQAAFNNGVNNSSYNKDNSCIIKGCWAAGLEEGPCKYDTPVECMMATNDEEFCQICESDTYKALIHPDNWSRIANYNALTGQNNTTIDTVFAYICTFNINSQDTNSYSVEVSKEYIKNFKYDELLMAKHFLMVGRYEGRPYKYCENDQDKLRTVDMAVYMPSTANEYFYDYSADPQTLKPQFFCLNKNEGKVYKIK